MINRHRNLLLPTLLLMLASTSLTAGEVIVAVAANFTDAARQIATRFEQDTGHQAKISYGSTGKLYAQIEHGAPYEVFLAADVKRPLRAEQLGLAVTGSRFVYARGKLVLWGVAKDLFHDAESYLQQGDFQHLAIANPKTAPYGFAAHQVLQQLGLWHKLQTRLVRGDSIAQTFQFVATGNAEAGFIAYSQAKAWQGEPGSVWLIPQQYYDPIEQAAVLLNKGQDNPAAQAFMQFLGSEAAQTIISDFGYEVSAAPNHQDGSG
ncbi:MAG: molybdate ABC transporter substrate-binding protein [Chromatiales bacterium]|jgi:molybdate transport system substrate-binding protein